MKEAPEPESELCHRVTGHNLVFQNYSYIKSYMRSKGAVIPLGMFLNELGSLV